jgi:hypothetical protein
MTIAGEKIFCRYKEKEKVEWAECLPTALKVAESG